jgi:hypothetical protein
MIHSRKFLIMALVLPILGLLGLLGTQMMSSQKKSIVTPESHRLTPN